MAFLKLCQKCFFEISHACLMVKYSFLYTIYWTQKNYVLFFRNDINRRRYNWINWYNYINTHFIVKVLWFLQWLWRVLQLWFSIQVAIFNRGICPRVSESSWVMSRVLWLCGISPKQANFKNINFEPPPFWNGSQWWD